jgi:predicted HTH domain antitoxin
MNRLQIDYPERLPDAMQLSASEFEMEAKMAMAAKLYEMAKISSGAAADMVGVSRVFFLLQLSRYNVSMMNFDTTELVHDVDFSD